MFQTQSNEEDLPSIFSTESAFLGHMSRQSPGAHSSNASVPAHPALSPNSLPMDLSCKQAQPSAELKEPSRCEASYLAPQEVVPFSPDYTAHIHHTHDRGALHLDTPMDRTQVHTGTIQPDDDYDT